MAAEVGALPAGPEPGMCRAVLTHAGPCSDVIAWLLAGAMDGTADMWRDGVWIKRLVGSDAAGAARRVAEPARFEWLNRGRTAGRPSPQVRPPVLDGIARGRPTGQCPAQSDRSIPRPRRMA